MDNTLLTALIAAGSACIGALIPSVTSYGLARMNNKKDLSSKTIENQRNTYKNLIVAIQAMMNESNENNFNVFQSAVNDVLLFAGKNTANKVSNYYHNIVNLQNKGTGLNAKQHQQYQKDIINSMRKDLGICNEEIDTYLIAFRPSQSTKKQNEIQNTTKPDRCGGKNGERVFNS